jgi:Transcriptional regulators
VTEQESIKAFRAFNRYYTRIIGLLEGDFLESSYSLGEVRVLYEIESSKACTSRAIRDAIGIDAGYLSRMLESLSRRGLVAKAESTEDRRRKTLKLTRKGKAALARLDLRSDKAARRLLVSLSSSERIELGRHMTRIRSLLGEPKGGI